MKFVGRSILVVSPDFPYPPNHGGRVDIWNRIRALKNIGFTIDLVATVKVNPQSEDIEHVKSHVRTVYCCRRRNRIIDMLSLLPLQIKSRKGLKAIRLYAEYDIVLLEGEYTYLILGNSTLRTKVKIVRIHNNEQQYFKELCRSAGKGIRKLYYFLESLRLGRVSRLMRNQVAMMMFISRDEHTAFKNNHPEISSVVLPPCLTNQTFIVHGQDSKKVLFVGSFFMVNNREALVWYIKNVHPLLCAIEGYEFLVAGNSRGQDLGWLNELTSAYSNIRVYNSPPDISPLYETCSIFVNPMLHGTGVKLKTVEAVQNGLPVVSTTIGNQGTGFRHGTDILVADEPQMFADHVCRLLMNPQERKRIVASAQKFLKANYDQEKLLARFLSPLLECNN
ncbi:MAG: glycosyltransferase family 4 protein [Candidatus Zixiibacteriota bacterium]